MKTIAILATGAVLAVTSTDAKTLRRKLDDFKPLIVGGTEVPAGQRTYTVSLRTTPGGATECGGSLIAPKFVLTAAHCVTPGDLHYVAVGTRISSGTKDGVQVKIAKTVVHPKWNTPPSSHDFAVLELEKVVDTTKYHPVKITGASGADATPGTMSTTIGWGMTTEGGEGSNVLLQVDVPLVSNQECAKNVTGIDDSMICAGGKAGEDACNGDSGGPLVVKQGTEDVLVGVVSWGANNTCARAGIPGVYGRVSVITEWIKSLTTGVQFTK